LDKPNQLFVLCIKNIKHHDYIAFHKGHVYIANYANNIYVITSERGSDESFPKSYFEDNFMVMFPVMENLK
jgi:hypothetical protein